MASTNKRLWKEYNGKGFYAESAGYAERAATDLSGNSLNLTLTSNKVSKIGGKSISAVSATSATQDASGNVITTTYATKAEIPDISGKADKVLPAAEGNLASLNASGNLVDSGVPLESRQAADGGTDLSLVTTGEKFNWNTIRSVPASTSDDEDKVLAVDDQGTPVWTALENDIFGTQLLDENDQPILDETQTPPTIMYDASSTDQLWTGFAGKEFGAARAYADQDGNNIKATYATKEDLNTALGDIESLLAAL